MIDTSRVDLALAAVMMGVGEAPPEADGNEASWNAITGLHFALALAVEAPAVFEAYRAEWESAEPNDYRAFCEAAAWVDERHTGGSVISQVLSTAWAAHLLRMDP